jgi:hypothetical protein
MATLFRYGPYVWFSEDGAPPGAVHAWSFGPWPWWGQVVSITAQPFSTPGADRHLEVTSISSHAAPMERASLTVLCATSVPTGRATRCGSAWWAHEHLHSHMRRRL